METTRKRLLCRLVCLAFGLLLMGAAPLAAQAECKPIIDTSSKVFNTPTHMYITGNTNGLTLTTEMIYAAGGIYMKINGKWSAGGTTKDAEELVEKNQQKNRQTSKATCRYLKDELVAGEMAALYSMHDETSGKIDSQIWISKAKGLPLRQEDDIDLGAGKGKVHNSTRYEYGNVRPPI
ncbi:MAG TPA: hypothetical protein VKU44_08450 [Terriglobia bacterium]|nr:hypothetical protein [Terriglobia bacterium]